jgi:hypothetical protein
MPPQDGCAGALLQSQKRGEIQLLERKLSGAREVEAAALRAMERVQKEEGDTSMFSFYFNRKCLEVNQLRIQTTFLANDFRGNRSTMSNNRNAGFRRIDVFMNRTNETVTRTEDCVWG